MALYGDLEHYQLFGAKPHSLLLFKRTGEHLSFNLNVSFLCASAHQHMATTTENDHHCKNQRQSENNHHKHHTDRSGTRFEVTSTSHCQNQQNRSFPMSTAALILSESNLNPSFTEKHFKAWSHECADTTLYITIQRSNIDWLSCRRSSVCCFTVTAKDQRGKTETLEVLKVQSHRS